MVETPRSRLARQILARQDHMREAELGELPQSLLPMSHGSHLAGEPQLAKGDQGCGQRAGAQARGQCQCQRQIGGGLGNLKAADQVDEHIMIGQRQVGMAAQDCQQHGQAIGIDTLRHPPRGHGVRAIDQRLDFDQQRPAAIARHHDDAARHRLRMAR